MAVTVVLVTHRRCAPRVVAVAWPVPGALEGEEGDGVEQALALLGHGPGPSRPGVEEVIPAACF